MQQDWNTTATMIRGTLIDKEMKRTNRNLLLTCVIVLFGVGIYFASQWRYYENFFRGPQRMDSATLDQVKDPASLDRYYVTLQGENEVDTGYMEVETNSSGAEIIKANYVVIGAGSHYLIVKKNPGEKGPEYTGALVAMPAEVKAGILDAVAKENPEAARDFEPYMLDATNFRHDGYWGLGLMIPLLLMAIWILRVVVMRTSSPGTHPIVVMLARHGEFADVARKMDGETQGETVRFGQLKMTAEWLLLSQLYAFKAMRLDEVVWVYKKTTRKRVNFIPVGKEHSVVLTDRHALTIEARGGKEQRLDEFLAVIVPRLPNALVGFDEQLQKLQMKDAGAFAAGLWERKQ